MGTWGHGPFDSDGALDWLADLAHNHATIDDNDDIVAGSIDHDAVTAKVRTRLLEPGGDYCDTLYAAAGLVAAALHPELSRPHSNEGTRLGEAITAGLTDKVGLTSHSGYAALLRPEDAASLREQALTAVETLEGDRAWLSTWVTPVQDALSEVKTLLAP